MATCPSKHVPRSKLFPHFSNTHARLQSLLNQHASDQNAEKLFNAADALYDQHIQKVFDTCKPIVGTKRFGKPPSLDSKLHTKQFKARKAEIIEVRNVLEAADKNLEDHTLPAKASKEKFNTSDD